MASGIGIGTGQDSGYARTALVTGAARRIGRAIALRLAGEGFGLALHSSLRSAPEAEALAAELRAQGGRACVVTGDLGQASDVAALIDQASAALGPLSLLVNNASLYEPDVPGAFDAAFFDRLMAVNLRPPLQLASDFARALPDTMRGEIINIIDQKVWRLNPRYFSYTLSKSAFWTATQTMAQAYAPRILVYNSKRHCLCSEPLFRSYIFIRASEHWLKILSTYGVSRVIMRGQEPATVSQLDAP